VDKQRTATYTLTTLQVIPEGEDTPVAVYVRIEIDCPTRPAPYVIGCWGHHLRAVRDLLDDVARAFPKLTQGGPVTLTHESGPVTIHNPGGDPHNN
jgi:hypothetical protein